MMIDKQELNVDEMNPVYGGQVIPWWERNRSESNEDPKQVKANDNETVAWFHIP